MERKLVTVAVDGSAEFTTLTAAAAAQDPAQPLHFVLGAGTYYERPFLELVDYIITGAGMGQTVISAGAAGRDPWPGEERTGTFRSQTLFLGGGSARLEHLTVENTAGDGADRGQALAVYADASRVCMVDVSLHGNQDTLFTAPLPLAVRQKNGFRGPRENTPRLDTKQYYRDCEISGNIDFIFGGANAVFDHCRHCARCPPRRYQLYCRRQHAAGQAGLPVCRLHRAGQQPRRQCLSGPPVAAVCPRVLAGLRFKR